MIYVDQYPGKGWGKWQGGGHLLTTDIMELHAFARDLSLKREWFQRKTCPHYDLVASKRQLAISHGAIEIAFGQFPDDMLWCIYKNGEIVSDAYETTNERLMRLGGRLDPPT